MSQGCFVSFLHKIVNIKKAEGYYLSAPKGSRSPETQIGTPPASIARSVQLFYRASNNFRLFSVHKKANAFSNIF